ncbi:hypothetical protein AN901_205209 [Pseudomonas syringae pv. theae]|nr:hypothetical protein AN901_205209 [Pseudomonas syringae pv. theae]
MKLHDDAQRRTIVEILVPHAQRGNAILDALRPILTV